MTDWGVDQQLALDTALREFDRLTVSRLCQQFIDHVHGRPDPVDLQVGRTLLKKLQRKRHFPLLQDVAEALLTHGLDRVTIRHLYALAMIDRGRTVAADALLSALPEEVRNTDSEVRGAIGRLHKQRYISSGPAAGQQRADDLAAAVEAYVDAYRDAPAANYYHGINAAALLVLAAKDGIHLVGHEYPVAEATEIAEAILVGISAQVEPNLWEFATAAEACLVLKRFDDAVIWLARYVGSDADSFEYASTLRQFQQVWQLNSGAEPGLRLIPLLRNRLLQTDGGVLQVKPEEYTHESMQRFETVEQTLTDRGGTNYEKVFGWDRFQPLGWLREALLACRSVARIQDRYGNGVGTGSVLDGDTVHPGKWRGRVLLTNAHVVPDVVTVDDAYVMFSGMTDDGGGVAPTPDPVGELLWHSPKHEYDACFLALPDHVSPQALALPIRKMFPKIGAKNQARAYVIGHPLGSPQIQLSLHDSVVLHVDDVYAHYRSPTETGSSGSPVFDDNWRVIALHHGWTSGAPGAAGGASEANEGIRLDKLLAAVRSTVNGIGAGG